MFGALILKQMSLTQIFTPHLPSPHHNDEEHAVTNKNVPKWLVTKIIRIVLANINFYWIIDSCYITLIFTTVIDIIKSKCGKDQLVFLID